MKITIEVDSAQLRRFARRSAWAIGITVLVGSAYAYASQVGTLTSFSAGQLIRSADFNSNFQTIATAVNDNNTRIGDLTQLQTVSNSDLVAAINELTARVAALESDNTALTNLVAALETKTAPMSLSGTDLTFSGVNVYVNNGSGATANTNGLGNLIVGYNEANLDSYGVAAKAPGTQTRVGSHNLIVGRGHEYTSYGSFISGQGNESTASYNAITGGSFNTAGGYGDLLAGSFNIATGADDALIAGANNSITSDYSSITGGTSNYVSGHWSSISGGQSNSVTGDKDSISGGYQIGIGYPTTTAWSAGTYHSP
jgi:hypothetical protein